ncbi:MAG: HDIG domain-containing protein [bacterium]|nr:HDIG domain-containing protein [bacterium]
MASDIYVPNYILYTLKQLTKAGFEGFIVGGPVRDVLLNKNPNDWDVTTNATPEQIQELFPENFYDNSFGTVGVVLRIKEEPTIVHVTTYRSEGEYSDFRRPDSVIWGTTIEEDLLRRDFTINAIAMRVEEDIFAKISDSLNEDSSRLIPGDFVLIDPYGGLVDLQKHLIRAVGTASDRFHEDALRMLRAVRFSCQLEFEIERDTAEAIKGKSENLQHISGERIRDEFFKILKSDRAFEGVTFLDHLGLLQFILPEVVAGRGLDQRGHHIFDVFDHSLNALKHCPSQDVIVRLAALLHDIGKVVTHEVRDGINTFYNHDIVGAKMIRDIAYRLHLSKRDREKLYVLVRFHMFSVDTIQTDAAIRRFIHKVGVDNISDMVDLRIGDRLGSGTKDPEGWRLKDFKKRIETLLMPTFTVKDLAIDGRDVMRILNISPGPKIGEVLNQLFEEVLDDPGKNTKEYLEKRVKEIA